MTDEDDRRDVRSEAEGAVPDEKQTVASGEGTATPRPEEDPGAASSDDTDSGAAEHDDETSDSDKSDKKKSGSFWKELPVLVGVALVLALVIKAFAVQAFYIPSASMENTLQIGDRVLVNKIVYHTREIDRGDVVVFNGVASWDPEVEYAEPSNPVGKFFQMVGSAFGVVPGEKDYIKRVIGLPGDRIKCCDDGRLTVNGVPLNEKSYLFTDPVTGEQNKPSDGNFEVTVKEGHLWVMGDHRAVSSDSRAHRGDPGGGGIPEDRVIGRAFVIVWPVNRIDTLPIPKTFQQPALHAANALLPAAPLALGFLGAIPLTRLTRRLRARRAA
jgi:signal peptidase I